MDVYGALFWVGRGEWRYVGQYIGWVGMGGMIGGEWGWVGVSGGGCTV